jgi:hypothetical protein
MKGIAINPNSIEEENEFGCVLCCRSISQLIDEGCHMVGPELCNECLVEYPMLSKLILASLPSVSERISVLEEATNRITKSIEEILSILAKKHCR